MKKYLILPLCYLLLLCGCHSPEPQEAIISPTVDSSPPPLEEEQPSQDIPEWKGLIVLDAGQQAQIDKTQERLGPMTTETKDRVSKSYTGTVTGIPEYELSLAVALILEEILVDMGYEVLQTRRNHEVNLSNMERAMIANAVEADAFLSLHANGYYDSSIYGVFTLCITESNPHCASHYEQNRSLSEYILEAIVEETEALPRPIHETDYMTLLNWSKVPVTIVEMGFLSNPEEDKQLSTEEYRYAMAQGIANGLLKFLEGDTIATE